MAALTPPLLKSIVVGLAAYGATLEFYGSQPLEQRDPVVLRYLRAREQLAAVADGKLAVEGLPVLIPGSEVADAEIYQPHTGLDLAHSFDVDSSGRSVSAPYSGGRTWW